MVDRLNALDLTESFCDYLKYAARHSSYPLIIINTHLVLCLPENRFGKGVTSLVQYKSLANLTVPVRFASQPVSG